MASANYLLSSISATSILICIPLLKTQKDSSSATYTSYKELPHRHMLLHSFSALLKVPFEKQTRPIIRHGSAVVRPSKIIGVLYFKRYKVTAEMSKLLPFHSMANT